MTQEAGLVLNSKRRRIKNFLSGEVFLLYILCIAIWGSTWYAVHLQMGQVRPEFSVALRFLGASLFLLAFCLIKKINLRFKAPHHLLFLAQGFCVFFIGYIFSYKAVQHITSGVVAVFYCLMPFFNILFSRLFFKTPIEGRVLKGALLGIGGVALVFSHEWATLTQQKNFLLGILFSFLGAGFGSLGNMAAVKMSRIKLSVAAFNTWGMFYGSALAFLYCAWQGIPMVFDDRASYWWTFFFLAIFGSVVAFGAFYRLQNIIGASRASYMTVFFPVIALTYSWAFENFQWSQIALIGVSLVLAGNVFMIKPAKKH